MKSYADDELKFCFLLPVEDSDEEEVKAKLVKCEACQMTLKECDMKKHQSTHNLTKPFHCEIKGCFKKFNTEENLALHKKYFHNQEKYISLSLKKLKNLKNKIQNMNFDSTTEMEIEDLPLEQEGGYSIGKYICENKDGKVIDEKIFLSLKNKLKEGEYNERNFKENNDNIIGYISNGFP